MKKFRLLIIISLSVLSITSYSQVIDSLELPFMNLSEEEKLDTFLRLTQENQTKDVILAIKYARKSLTLSEQLGKETERGKAYRFLGELYSLESDYGRGYEYLIMALEIFQNLGDTLNLINVRISLGDLYYDLKKYSDSRNVYIETLKLTTDPDFLAILNCNIGNTYLSEDKYEEALTQYMKSLDYKTTVKKMRSISDTYTGLAIYYENKGQYTEALKYYQMSYEIEKAENDKVAMASSYLNIGDLLGKMKQYNRALEEIQKGIQLARECNLKNNILIGYNMISTIYREMGDYQTAYKWRTKSYFLKDSIFTSELAAKIAEEKALYELDLKDANIKILKKENTTLLWQRTFYLTASILALFVVIISYVFYKRKGKLTAQLEVINNELENKNIKLFESEKVLKELVKTKDRYISVLAHDLRSPFQGLIGLTSILRKDFDKMQKEEIREFLNLIESSIRNLFDLLDNLLQWTKMHTGILKLEKAEVSLNNIIDEIVEIYQHNAMLKNIILMPNLQNDIKIYASENMLKSIIRNLISNAIKFTPSGGYVKIKASIVNNTAEIRVSDTGSGIPEEKLRKIFTDERFTTKGTEGEESGGLGLILVKEFVELHKGTINVTSEEGRGTEFIIVLPLK
ncbi:MAG: ATP-binding protein [Ignavibacteria bacterium]